MTRPEIVTAWMLGHYQARVDDNKFLSDVSLWNLDPRYVAELERRAYKEVSSKEGFDVMYKKLQEAYKEIGDLEWEIRDLQRLLTMANDRIGQD